MSNVSKVVTGAVALLVVNTLSILLAGYIGVQVVKHEISGALEDSGLASGSSDTSPFAGQHAEWSEPGFFDKYANLGQVVKDESSTARQMQKTGSAADDMDGVPQDFDWQCTNATYHDLRANGLNITRQQYAQGMSGCH